jgi:hypothetical protein
VVCSTKLTSEPRPAATTFAISHSRPTGVAVQQTSVPSGIMQGSCVRKITLGRLQKRLLMCSRRSELSSPTTSLATPPVTPSYAQHVLVRFSREVTVVLIVEDLGSHRCLDSLLLRMPRSACAD